MASLCVGFTLVVTLSFYHELCLTLDSVHEEQMALIVLIFPLVFINPNGNELKMLDIFRKNGRFGDMDQL